MVDKQRQPRALRGGVNGSAIEHWNLMDGRKLAIPEPVDQADVLILLGGYGDASGTFTAANWAHQIGTPILPVATFNMAAGEIFERHWVRTALRRHWGHPSFTPTINNHQSMS
ncbi:MAG: hypothetical protein PVJ68_03020 [Candidatus Thiodiazotropha sp.]